MNGQHAFPSPSGMALRLPHLLSLAGVLAVVGLMLYPVQTGFGRADVALPVAAAVLAVLGLCTRVVSPVRLRLGNIDFIAAVWLLYVLLRAWYTPQVPCLHAVVRAVSLASLYAGLRLLFSCSAPSALFTEGSLTLFALLQALLCIFQLLTGSSRHALFPFTGTFLNPGPCSAALFMGACLGLYRFFSPIPSQNVRVRQLVFWLTAGTLVLCSLLLPVGWSRAALVAGLCCLVAAGWRRMSLRLRCSLVLCLLAAFLLLYALKRGSADGRVLFFAVSSSAVAQSPFFGSGIGTFFHAYGQQTAALHSHMPLALAAHADTLTYALSDGMRVAVEQGVAGLLIALMLVLNMLHRLRRRSSALWLVLFGLLVFSLFSYPFQLLPFQLMLVLLAAYTASPRRRSAVHHAAKPRGRSLGRAFVLTVFAVISAFLVVPSVRQRVLATRQIRMVMGSNGPRVIEQYRSLLPLMSHDAQFLFRCGQALASCGRYNESNQVLRQGTLVSNDSMFYVLIGHNYQHLQAFDQACQAYRQAHGQSPARHYPLLCLMHLYRQQGMREQAVRIAHCLLRLPVKQDSPLVREAREEARSCILEQ